MSHPNLNKGLEMVNKGEWTLHHITVDELKKIIGKSFKEAIADSETLAVLHKLGKGVVFKKPHETETGKMVDLAPMPFTKEEILAVSTVVMGPDGKPMQWIKRTHSGSPADTGDWVELHSDEGMKIFIEDYDKPAVNRRRTSDVVEIPAIGGINYKGGAAQLINPTSPNHRIAALNAQNQWHAIPARYPTTKKTSKGKPNKTNELTASMKERITDLLVEAKKAKNKEEISRYTMYLERLNK